MKKVLIIGGSGMVASRFIDLAKNNIDITSVDEKTLDITNENSIYSFFKVNGFDSVINFAAFTNVDAAEKERGDEKGLVWRLNVNGPKYLSKICTDKNIFLVHISTDFVFPGNEKIPGPYKEDSNLPEDSDGIGWYGWTKNIAEKEVSKHGSRNTIVRYGYPFRASVYDLKKDWARNLINLYKEDKLYPLFTDQIQSIVFIDELVDPLLKIINEEIPGVFHIVSNDLTTPFEAGSYLLNKFTGKKVDLQKGLIREFLKSPGRTPRPILGGLETKKTQIKLGVEFKNWKQMIDEFIKQFKTEI